MLIETVPANLWHVVVTTNRQGRAVRSARHQLTFTTRNEAREYRRGLISNGYQASILKQPLRLGDAQEVS
jgi:DNA/RNA endonuclease G (NUC1)